MVTHGANYIPQANEELKNCTRNGSVSAEATAMDGTRVVVSVVRGNDPSVPGGVTPGTKFSMHIDKHP